MTRSLSVIYTSTSGHTEYVVDAVVGVLALKAKDVIVTRMKAELSQPGDLLKGDALLLASGTWNTGNVEGQLSPYMEDFLLQRANKIELKGKPVAVIGLGDERYHYAARATDHLVEYVKSHGGRLLLPPLRMVNEPYGQEEKALKWAEQFIQEIMKLPVSAPSA